MNRKNIWVHITIAAVVISFAAVIGQIQRLRSDLMLNLPERSEKIVYRAPDATFPTETKGGAAEVQVKFRAGVSLADIKNIAAKNNDELEDNYEYVKGLTTIDDLDGLSAEQVAAQYSAMKDVVEYAEPVQQINLEPTENYHVAVRRSPDVDYNIDTPNDPMFDEQWALNNDGQTGGKANSHIAALKAWKKSHGSNDVVVAVLDTGVDYTHRDLINNIWIRPDSVPAYTDAELGAIDDYEGFNAAENTGDPMDDNGHGTHCAGIIGAEGNNGEGIAGINWNVEIMPLKFLGRSGSGSTRDAIEAINYAIDRKKNGVNLRVISASWGSTQYSKALEDAIKAAGDAGILFVAAAGNSSTNNDKWKHYPSNYDLPNVVSVAATDKNDALASFSNYGAKTVHIAAPGREIVSTWLDDDYREASGTSMATPYVSGAAALILSSEPQLSVKALRDRLLKSVDKIDSLSGKVASGGRLNAAKALGD